MRVFACNMSVPRGWHVMPAAPQERRRPVQLDRAPPVECYGLLVSPAGSIVARIFGHMDADRWPIAARVVDNRATFEVRGWCGDHGDAECRALKAFGFGDEEVT